MSRPIEEQKKVAIQPGFSPKPARILEPLAQDSPTKMPETNSPQPDADERNGPVVATKAARARPTSDVTVKDGVVEFGK